MLRDKYFTITEKSNDGERHAYKITLTQGHEIYRGHFPDNPISPGVCSIQTIRECCEDALGRRLAITNINQCRFLSILTPQKNDVVVNFAIAPADADTFKIEASISNENEQFVSLKATFTLK